MKEKNYETRCGSITYWIDCIDEEAYTLVFLPGLTADHRLFDKQLEYFQGKWNLFVWDAPAHAKSRPFSFDFTLKDKATWLKEILDREKIRKPIIIGQSMGGYVGQAFEEYFPHTLCGFISIDSAPIQRHYMSNMELWFLERTEPMYRMYPWKALVRDAAKGLATTPYGQQNMREIMLEYSSDPKYYAHLAGQGFFMLAQAIKADLRYEITCPALLICGEKDHAGFTAKYNRRWHEQTGLEIHWIKDAGHNANADKPEEINAIIENFLDSLKAKEA